MKSVPKSNEVWYAHIPKEENENEIMRNRPCVIVDNDDSGGFHIIKLTTHEPRLYDPFDVLLKDWRECGLTKQSTARVSTFQKLDIEQIDNLKGILSERDREAIIESLMRYLES